MDKQIVSADGLHELARDTLLLRQQIETIRSELTGRIDSVDRSAWPSGGMDGAWNAARNGLTTLALHLEVSVARLQTRATLAEQLNLKAPSRVLQDIQRAVEQTLGHASAEIPVDDARPAFCSVLGRVKDLVLNVGCQRSDSKLTVKWSEDYESTKTVGLWGSWALVGSLAIACRLAPAAPPRILSTRQLSTQNSSKATDEYSIESGSDEGAFPGSYHIDHSPCRDVDSPHNAGPRPVPLGPSSVGEVLFTVGDGLKSIAEYAREGALTTLATAEIALKLMELNNGLGEYDSFVRTSDDAITLLQVIVEGPVALPFALAKVASNPERYVDPWLTPINEWASSMPLSNIFFDHSLNFESAISYWNRLSNKVADPISGLSVDYLAGPENHIVRSIGK